MGFGHRVWVLYCFLAMGGIDDIMWKKWGDFRNTIPFFKTSIFSILVILYFIVGLMGRKFPLSLLLFCLHISFRICGHVSPDWAFSNSGNILLYMSVKSNKVGKC